MAQREQGGSRGSWGHTRVVRRSVLVFLTWASVLLSSVMPSPADAAAPAVNDRMHILEPDPAMTLAKLAVPGRYTLVLLSPPEGQCAPCDQLWAQLAETEDLRIEVFKVRIEEGSTRLKIFNEVRRLIDSSMELASLSDILFPMGVMLDPNGVVVQATFGKPRIEKKIAEVSAALATSGTSPSSSASAPTPPPVASSHQGRGPSREGAALDPKLAAVALGAGVVAGGLTMVTILGAVLGQRDGVMRDPRLCSPDGDCNAAGLWAIARRNELRRMQTAAWVVTGVGAVIAAEAGVFMIYERAGRTGAVEVTVTAAPTGAALAVQGKF